MKFYTEQDYEAFQNETQVVENTDYGCGFCWDKKRNQEKELFFLDKANNMRVCHFCPNCGRKYEE